MIALRRAQHLGHRGRGHGARAVLAQVLGERPRARSLTQAKALLRMSQCARVIASLMQLASTPEPFLSRNAVRLSRRAARGSGRPTRRAAFAWRCTGSGKGAKTAATNRVGAAAIPAAAAQIRRGALSFCGRRRRTKGCRCSICNGRSGGESGSGGSSSDSAGVKGGGSW